MGFVFARCLTYLFRAVSILFYRQFFGFVLFCYCAISPVLPSFILFR